MKKLLSVFLCVVLFLLSSVSVSALDIAEKNDDFTLDLDNIIGTAMTAQSAIINGIDVKYVMLSEKVSDNSVYKIDFRYRAAASVPLSFMTAEADSVYTNQGFVEAPNFVVINAAASVWNNDLTVYVNTDMEGGINGEGEALFVYWPANLEFSVYNVELENLGTLVGNGGVSMIKGLSESESQALRYYFNYNTITGNELVVNDETYTILSRGFLLANGGEGGLLNAAVTFETAKSTDKIIDINTTDLEKVWSFKNVGGKDNLTYSTYITNFAAEDGTYNQSMRLYVKGYVRVKINGQVCTFYSTITNYTVKDIADYLWYHNEGEFTTGNEVPEDKRTHTINGVERQLVWNQEFNTNGVLQGVTYKYDTMVSRDPELKTSTSENNIFVKDGNLVLRMIDNQDGTFTTAKSLTTINEMSFKYGYVEMKAKMPYQYGMWFSFWMQPDRNLLAEDYEYWGEVDIVETFWKFRSTDFTLHKWGRYVEGSVTQRIDGVDVSNHEGQASYVFENYENLKNEYHIYGFEWTPEYMKAYIDGECYYTVYIDEESEFSNERVGMECFHDYFYLCWNNWMHASYADKLVLENGYADYAIDYVRLYQTPDTEFIVEY